VPGGELQFLAAYLAFQRIKSSIFTRVRRRSGWDSPNLVARRTGEFARFHGTLVAARVLL